MKTQKVMDYFQRFHGELFTVDVAFCPGYLKVPKLNRSEEFNQFAQRTGHSEALL